MQSTSQVLSQVLFQLAFSSLTRSKIKIVTFNENYLENKGTRNCMIMARRPEKCYTTGREPWESMKTFLSNPEEKAKLLDQLKASKGEHFTDFHCVELQTQQKQASEYLESLPLF